MNSLSLSSPTSYSHEIPSSMKKPIQNKSDIELFHKSLAIKDINQFINSYIEVKKIDKIPEVKNSTALLKIMDLLNELENHIDECPPNDAASRCGNTSFRDWLEKACFTAHKNIESLIREHTSFPLETKEIYIAELSTYFCQSFGNSTRIDYGTGHEFSFLAFLICLHKLEICTDINQLVDTIFSRYLDLVRSLQMTYSMEPAGSHGVYHLDDHQFLPYLFGFSQLEASDLAEYSDFVKDFKPTKPNQERKVVHYVSSPNSYNGNSNTPSMFFNCLAYTAKVKTQVPFSEHSGLVFQLVTGKDRTGNLPKIKALFNDRVLSNIPMLQHFPFGTLLQF